MGHYDSGRYFTMKVIDLTHTIKENMPVYPGTDTPKFIPANSYEKDGFKETLGAPVRAIAWFEDGENR